MDPTFKRIHRLASYALFAAAAFIASAHQTSDSYLSVKVDGSNISGQWDISLLDLDRATGLDGNLDGDITGVEAKAKRPEIAAYALSRLHIKINGIPCKLHIIEQLLDTFSDGTYSVARFEAESPGEPRNVEIDYRAFFDVDPQHRGLLRLECGDTTQTAVFTPDNPARTFELSSPSSTRQFREFVREGVWHIWRGFDHILFLLALLLPAVLRRTPEGWRVVEQFRPAFFNVLKIVTAFTVAHSITLSLATLGVIRLPSKLTESAIAASVILAATNNVYPLFPERGWMIAFGFGLVHGFGFANVLADLGLAKRTLVLALVGFNLGVEAGQLAIVALFLPLAFGLRGSWFYQNLTFRYGSAMIVLLAATWMVERIFEIKVLPF